MKNVRCESRGPGPSQVFDREWLRKWADAHKDQSPQARLVVELLDENERLSRTIRPAYSTDPVETFQLAILADDGCPHVLDLWEAA